MLAAPGDLDPSFAGTGVLRFDHGYSFREGTSIAVQPDGKYLVSAVAWGWETFSSPIFRYNTDHTIDTTFGYQGQAADYFGIRTSIKMSGTQILATENVYQFVQDSVTSQFYRDVLVSRYNANGQLDTTFGSGGRTPTFHAGSGGSGEQRLNALAVQPDGKIVAVGYTTMSDNSTRVIAVRYNTDGSLDTTFGNFARFHLFAGIGDASSSGPQEARAVQVMADGTIMVAGTYSSTDGGTHGFTYALYPPGHPLGDPSNWMAAYQPHYGATGGMSRCDGAVNVSSTRVALACTLAQSGRTYAFLIGVLNTGVADPGFTPSAMDLGGVADEWRAVTLAADNTLFVAGNGGAGRLVAGHFQSDGTPIAFGPSGFYTMPEAQYSTGAGVAIAGTEIVATGTRGGPDSDVLVATFDATATRTSVDYRKGTASTAIGPNPKLLPNGQVLITGTAGIGNNPNFTASRLNADGSFDATFGATGFSDIVIPNMDFLVGVRDTVLQPDGNLLVTGDFGGFSVGGAVRLGVARLLASGGGDPAFNEAGTPGYNYVQLSGTPGANVFTRSVALQSDGKILASGAGTAGGFRQMTVVRFNADGTLDTSYGASGVATTNFAFNATGRGVAITSDDKAVTVASSGATIRMARFTTSGALDDTFGSGGIAAWNAPAGYTVQLPNRIFILPTGRILVLISALTSTDFGAMAVRFNSDGSLDTSYAGGNGWGYIPAIANPGAGGNFFAGAVAPNGKLVAVGYTFNNSTAATGTVVRFKPNGLPDTGFGASAVTHYGDALVYDELSGVAVARDGSMFITGVAHAGSLYQGLVMKTVPDVTAVVRNQINDFDATLTSDLLWQDTSTGSVQGWLMNGLTATSIAALLPAGPYVVTHTADLNGDGKADLLIRNTADGSIQAWLMDGLNVIGSGTIAPASSGWSVVKVADLNGDGMADIIAQHTDGTVVGWLMNGVNIVGVSTFAPAGSGWSVTKVGDLNGDGMADILWEHTSGAMQAWLMNGLTVTQLASFVPAGTGWHVVMIADFNGDGKADIFWQHDNGATQAWMMDGLSVIGLASFTPAGTGWFPKLAGDINGDRSDDLFWEHSSGASQTWLMNGTSVIGLASFVPAGTGWTATHLLDFNGDGKRDVVWKHTNGGVQAWLMDGLSITGIGSFVGAGTYVMVPAMP